MRERVYPRLVAAGKMTQLASKFFNRSNGSKNRPFSAYFARLFLEIRCTVVHMLHVRCRNPRNQLCPWRATWMPRGFAT
jgi:hypothetical protein